MAVLKGAADEALAILKSDALNDTQRKGELEGILEKLSDDQFHNLTVLSQLMVDYEVQNTDAVGGKEEIIEVNVEFGDSDEEDEG